jgi:4-amino-4-deoxychorismate lyase
MSLLLESIKIQYKKLQNIDFHNDRLNLSRKKLFNTHQKIDLNNEIGIPTNLGNEVFKCRVLYAQKIEKIEFQPYLPRIIKSLQIVHANYLNYDYKFADRSTLESLIQSKNTADDILIIKNGLVTDTSYANIVFFDGRQWVTPSTPLLKGTKRSQLLQKQVIREEVIKIEDLQKFEFAKIINAMIDLEESNVIQIVDIT